MSQTRSKLRLGTYVLHHENDLKYYQALQPYLMLMLKRSGLGYLRHETLTRFNLRDRALEKMLDIPTCLVCLISPNFIQAIHEQRFLWSELVHAHRKQQLLILPIVAEDVEPFRALNLLRTIPRILPNCAPLSEVLQRGDHATWLARLGSACHGKMEASLHYHELAGKHWKRARAYHNTDDYAAFGENFGHTKYGLEAERYRQELLEEELWQAAQSTDDTAAYLEYLTESPLETYREEAVERIVSIEIDTDNVRADVMANPDIGLVFDYKSRYRELLDYEMVEEKLRDTLGEPLRLRGDHPWPEIEAMYLKRRVYEECSGAESFTYSYLEQYAKASRDTIIKTLKKLKARKSNAVFYCLLPVIALIFFSMVDLLLSVGLVAALLKITWGFVTDHYLMGPVILLTPIYLMHNVFKYLDHEMRTCERIVKAITKEMVELQVAFIIKTEYGRCLRELHNMEEWGHAVLQKGLLSYAFADAEKMEFHSYTLREMIVTPPPKPS